MDRTAILAALCAERFDVLVIGGGITGAGVARDAAMRGLRVALVEREDFASGTSSRSSRLVHGGVRYLEHGYLHLVFEASRERRILLKTAPHLVRPQAFTWPVYEGARVPRWKLAAGLTLYDTLSLYRNVARHERLSRNAVHEREPALKTDGLNGGAVYYDAATDDARLTLSTVLSAVEAGAVVLSHAAVVRIESAGSVATGAVVRDALSDNELHVEARTIVNATGPWSDELRRLEDPNAARALRGTKGAHIAVDRARVGNTGTLTLLSPLDARVMFIIESGDQTIIGTTDTQTDASANDVRASEADVEYLLKTANTFFPAAMLGRMDVIAAWAGIRPLIASGFGGTEAGASREHAITRGSHGMLTITGGKLTTYRAMAAEIVDRVVGELGASVRRSATAKTPLAGGDVDVESALTAANSVCKDSAVATRLVHAYGSQWRAVWEFAKNHPSLAERIEPSRPYIMAEVVHAVTSEMARTLGDVLIRRTHLAYETRDNGRAAARRIAPLVSEVLGWDEARREAELRRYAEEAERQFAVEKA